MLAILSVSWVKRWEGRRRVGRCVLIAKLWDANLQGKLESVVDSRAGTGNFDSQWARAHTLIGAIARIIPRLIGPIPKMLAVLDRQPFVTCIALSFVDINTSPPSRLC